MATIEVDEGVKRTLSFAARMADVPEGEIVRRLIAASSLETKEHDHGPKGVAIYAIYEGHRTQALYFAPARVEIIDGPLRGKSFGSPTGAARAVVRYYNPSVNDNRNGWGFWQVDNGGGPRVWLQSIRPTNAKLPSRQCQSWPGHPWCSISAAPRQECGSGPCSAGPP
jgi:hypothetical protein